MKHGKIVTINYPKYGEVKLDVSHVIALIPEKFSIVFECVIWTLSEEDYKIVDEAWTNYINGTNILGS
jgi:hypothetical protein